MKKVGIVIPIYNSYEYVVSCIDSVLKYTKNVPYELILINDCSTDNRIESYLDGLKNGFIKVIHNKVNLGFVKNCNKGIQLAEEKNDIVLLNSDTEVTPNWLRKMQEHAYSSELIGSVTPLTNNGSQASVPYPWKDNKLPKSYSINGFSKLIEECSLKILPQVTTAVGFCIYMKRQVIREIGVFDANKYGKGYGEESDWSMRAYRKGYKNILDDTTFIYHKGSMSFTSLMSLKLKDHQIKNRKIFHRDFPEASKLLDYYEKKGSIDFICMNIRDSLYRKKRNRKRILFVNAGDVDSMDIGAFIHVRNIIKGLSYKYDFISLYRDGENLILHVYDQKARFKVYIFRLKYKFDSFELQNKYLEDKFEKIINGFNIDIVHFQTPQELPLSLIYVSKKNNKKVILTAHDFLIYCRNYLLITYCPENSKNFRFCNFEKDLEFCKKCLERFFPENIKWKNYPEDRRNFLKDHILWSIDFYITPSEYIKKEILSLYKKEISKEKVFAIEHGLAPVVYKDINKKKVKNVTDGKLNIAFVGTFSETKGSQIFTKIVNELYNDFNFFVFGRVEDLTSKMFLKNKCHFYGEYKQNEIYSLLKHYQIDLGLILTIVNESFCYTLSELWREGIPVLGLDRGAVGDRIRRNGMKDMLINRNFPEKSLIQKLRYIKENPNFIKNKKYKIPKIKSLKQNISEYERFYSKVVIKKKKPRLESKDDKLFFIRALKYGEEIKKDKYSINNKNKITWQNKGFAILNRLGLAGVFRPLYRYLKSSIK